MKTIFDENTDLNQVNEILPFFDVDFNLDNLMQDIRQHTPYLINFIGEDAYNLALYDHIPNHAPSDYSEPSFTEEQQELVNEIVLQIQTYILTMAALSYMQSGDLEHTTAGRKQNKTENQATPWEWQIDRDNAAHSKRAFRALDRLFVLLDKLSDSSWTDSDAYTLSKSVFIYNTQLLDGIIPIGDSGFLYHKLLPFMRDHELECIMPMLSDADYQALKTSIAEGDETTLSNDNKLLLSHIRKAVAYLTMADGYEMLPVEMFPDKVQYNESVKDRSTALKDKVKKLRDKSQTHLRNVQQQYAKMSVTTETIARDPNYGLQEDSKHVNL